MRRRNGKKEEGRRQLNETYYLTLPTHYCGFTNLDKMLVNEYLFDSQSILGIL